MNLDLPLDTREGQLAALTAIVQEALCVYVGPDENPEPWTDKPRDCSGLDTAINALSEIREVRKAFPLRAAKTKAPKVEAAK
jgi:hypothetical protein